MFLKEKINFKILKIIFFFIFLLLFCYEVSAEKSYIIIDEKKITNEIHDNYLDNYYPQFNSIKYSCYLNEKYLEKNKFVFMERGILEVKGIGKIKSFFLIQKI